MLRPGARAPVRAARRTCTIVASFSTSKCWLVNRNSRPTSPAAHRSASVRGATSANCRRTAILQHGGVKGTSRLPRLGTAG
jgi:hypothetical protein